MGNYDRRTGGDTQQIVSANIVDVMPQQTIERSPASKPAPYINEVTNVVEVRSPTLDEMKAYFLILLKTDNDIVEAIRKLI